MSERMVRVTYTTVSQVDVPVSCYDGMSEDDIAEYEREQADTGESLDVALLNVISNDVDVEFYGGDPE